MTKNKPTSACGDIGVWFPTLRANTGADSFTIRLANALRSRGIKADIAWLPARAEYAPYTVTAPAPPPWANLVHVNSFLHKRFLPTNLPLVVTIHGCVHDPALTPYKTFLQNLYHQLWIKKMEENSLSIAAQVTAVSNYTRQISEHIFAIPDIALVHNWVDSISSEPKRRDAPNRPFRLLFVGKMSRRKGADLLGGILENLGEDYELRFTGNPLRGISLPSNMVSIGWTHDQRVLTEWYESADALLFPSRMEGLPLAVMEAMARGLPVITSNATSLPELIEHCKNGLLCEKDNIESFSMAVRWLKDNPREWHKMRKGAIEKVKREYTEEAAVSKYVQIYKRILSERL